MLCRLYLIGLGLIWVGDLDYLVVINSVVTCKLMCIETWFVVFAIVVWVASVRCSVPGVLDLLLWIAVGLSLFVLI